MLPISLTLISAMFPAHLHEVTKSLTTRSQSPPKRYNGLKRLGLTVPVQRKAVKQGYSFCDESAEKLIRIWDYIWNNSECYEVMYQALYFYQGKNLNIFELQRIKRWVDRCCCWEFSDDLSKIFADVVERNPEWIMPTLRQWNRSRSLWKRRQSVVSLIEYASKRDKVLPFYELIGFIEPLLDDEEYYVQKGVGWTLREIYNVYPKDTLAYIDDNVTAISPVAYTAATEKLPLETKVRLKERRKASRKRASGGTSGIESK